MLIARGASVGRLAFALAALAAAGGMLADVVAGHAAAGDLAGLQVVAQWLHILAVGSWVGGLAALLLSVRGSVADEKSIAVRRFSRWAGFALAAIAATGLLRAIQEVGTLDALVSSDFGRLVIAKTALFGALALLGAANHFVSVPAAARNLGLLRRIGRVELAVGAVVLLLTGLLVTSPRHRRRRLRRRLPHPAPAVIVDGHDFGTSVKVRLEASPGAAGFNTFRATVTDYDTGAPVTADHVTLRFSIPARSDVGGSRLDLAPSGPGIFTATGGNLSLEGAWQIAALVARGTSSVEVPLQLITNVAPAPHRRERGARAAHHLHRSPIRWSVGSGLSRSGPSGCERSPRHLLRCGRERAPGPDRRAQPRAVGRRRGGAHPPTARTRATSWPTRRSRPEPTRCRCRGRPRTATR